ncbi:hypothetical protein [Thermobifida cellulosilytica]|nr:hypothetical protein [Thermobifida cellulosilytica]
MRGLFLVGIALAVGGIVLGTVPVESAGSGCGSAFVPTSGFHDILVGSQGCSEVRSALLPWALSLLAMGTVLVIGAGLAVLRGACGKPNTANTGEKGEAAESPQA